jgi:hypothetical protein
MLIAIIGYGVALAVVGAVTWKLFLRWIADQERTFGSEDNG